jgi:hypothetical protein
VKLGDRYRNWRRQRRERRTRDYEHLSGAERAEVERLREEHDPLGQMARSRTPPPFRDDQF